MILNANRPFDDCFSIEQVVELINDPFASSLSSEKLAAIYAFDAVIGSDFPEITEDNIEAHLDVLKDYGAEFVYAESLSLAMKMGAENCLR